VHSLSWKRNDGRPLLKVTYKNGVGPSITFKNKGDDSAAEVLKLDTWRAEHIADYLREKLKEQKPEELPAGDAAAAAATGEAKEAGDNKDVKVDKKKKEK
jgi:hypothetical protein